MNARGLRGGGIAAVVALAVLAGVPGALGAASIDGAVIPAHVIDGPNAGIVGVGGIAVAQDGRGGLAYLESVDGVTHVFVATLAGGAWSAPTDIDPDGATNDSQARIAAANGGRLAVVWISGGELYGAVVADGGSGWSAPQAIAPATDNPALAMGISGTAYVAFVAPNVGGSDIDVARLDRSATSFVLLDGALETSPASDPGAGSLEGPAIAVSADATAVVAWGESDDGSTHVIVRRVDGLAPSSVINDATLGTLDGESGGAADSPSVGIGDNSNYAWVVFRQSFSVGDASGSRIVERELIGDLIEPPLFVDSLGALPDAGSATAPAFAVNGLDRGLIASELAGTNALAIDSNNGTSIGVATTAAERDDTVAPQPVVALARYGAGLVVYQTDGGANLEGEPLQEARAGTPLTLSSGALGGVDAAAGYAAAADDGGAASVVFAQGSPGALAIVASTYVPPPSPAYMDFTQAYLPTDRPALSWGSASNGWSTMHYRVLVDGRTVGTTANTELALKRPLAQGTHEFEVVASDLLGQSTASEQIHINIDSHRPAVSVAAGGGSAGLPLSFQLTMGARSGIAAVHVNFGDHDSQEVPIGSTRSTTVSTLTHRYAKAGNYVARIQVSSNAGLATTVLVPVSVS